MAAGGLFLSVLSFTFISPPPLQSIIHKDEMLISLGNMTPLHLPLNLSFHLSLRDILVSAQ